MGMIMATMPVLMADMIMSRWVPMTNLAFLIVSVVVWIC